ncbi:exocyst complex component EXO70H1-like [Mangifera indica]|uniref:exocyst complex component EXO70H1-like n=1 Tax=Mangifera indica TaxID=29780 RepID=UPI001CFAF8EB|nr:exocyst complex component EXO70H1-like [Mangifera indica]
MPRKGMRSICFNPKTTSLLSIPRQPRPTPALLTNRPSFSESTMEKIIESATEMITKWDPDSSTYARVTSLFYEDKREAMQFLKCVNGLQKAMHLLVSEDSASEKLIQAQNLMQIAMKRLQKEFYQILSMNRAHLDPESVSTRSSRSTRSSISDYEDDGEDDVRVAGDSITEVEEESSIAMADLKSIADCMISAGYAKECISIYKIIRKSIIDEGIYRLGVERFSNSQINKMDWEALDIKIKNWLDAVKIAMRTLFNGERILCDHVFASSDSIKESCFGDISKEGALILFSFPELVAKTKKSPPEKMFRVLGMYTAIAENWPEIESIFSHESISTVRLQALNSLVKLNESVRGMISDFESSIQKDSSKFLAPGGGIHPLTVQAMNYLSLLADYSNVLTDILADWPPPAKSSLPESYFDSPDSTDGPAPSITLHVTWLILVLLCKLDTKAKLYKDVSLSYLFLANNLQHVVSKVRTSNLQYLLGDEWINRHEAKVRQFAANYERVAWDQVVKSLPANPTAAIAPDQAKDYFTKFQSSFEQVCKQQRSCIVPDSKLRDYIKLSIERKLVAKYRELYDKHRLTVEGENNAGMVVGFSPGDVGNYLSELFFGKIEASGSGSRSSSSHRRHLRLKA